MHVDAVADRHGHVHAAGLARRGERILFDFWLEHRLQVLGLAGSFEVGEFTCLTELGSEDFAHQLLMSGAERDLPRHSGTSFRVHVVALLAREYVADVGAGH
ncbi:MAG: hypothetical protein EBR15_04190, partial [Gammaproteobacteria bacterium]|nr:hypothetical protein [Gammaproteobacteria bacterium]